MKYDLWELKLRIEKAYATNLKYLAKQINNAVAGVDDPVIIVRRLKLIANSPAYQRFAEAAAMKMVTSLFTDAGRTWRQAARENAKGRFLYEAIMQELGDTRIGATVAQKVAENAQLIKSMSLTLAQESAEYIQARSMQGVRPQEIASELMMKFPKMSQSKAVLIARTETSKANTALTQARATDLGLDWYIWRTTKDSRRRSSHAHMEGVLVSWNLPPSPEELDPKSEQDPYGNYHAGDTFNCRCYPQPIVNFDRVTWPARVYIGGSIKRMTKAAFFKMFDIAA